MHQTPITLLPGGMYMTEKIAVIGGTGDLGFGLALRWAKAGKHIIIGSRKEEKAKKTVEKMRTILGKM